MKTKWMLVPRTITTTARLTLAFGVLMSAILVLGSGQGDERFFQLSDRVDHAAGLALLAFTAFLASHRLRRVDLVNEFMALRGSMDVARKLTIRDGEIRDLVAGARGRLSISLRSNIERPRTLVGEMGALTDPRIRLREQPNLRSIGQAF